MRNNGIVTGSIDRSKSASCYRRSKVRCLATHANPTTGARDVPMLTTLTQVFGQEKPTFGVVMVPRREGTCTSAIT